MLTLRMYMLTLWLDEYVNTIWFGLLQQNPLEYV